MAIPDYQTVMLPLLRLLGDGRERSLAEAVEAISTEFRLAPDERQQLIPSGTSTVIGNRVGWARTYMKKAGLVDSSKRGFVRATGRGLDVLKQKLNRIDVEFLGQFPEFLEFRTLRRDDNSSVPVALETTPDEAMEDAYQRLRLSIESELLQRAKTASPAFFEKLVVDLLVKMGYGGSFRDAGKAIGRSGDGGIDGVIKEDRLGLDVIYIQAKRWNTTPIGRPEVQQFAGALQGQRAGKGIFITTSRFTQDARDFVDQIGSKIVLIDGESLAQYMIDFNVGVSRSILYEIKRIDSDYFEEGL